MNLPDFFGKRLREARSATGMSQADLAQAIDVSVQAISAFETGVRNPTVYTLQKIADVTYHPITFFLEDHLQSPPDVDLRLRISRLESEIESIKEEIGRREALAAGKR